MKIGDRVKVLDCSLGIHGGMEGIINRLPYDMGDYRIKVDGSEIFCYTNKLQLVEDTMKVGDILVNDDDKCKVLAVVGDLIATSTTSIFDEFGSWDLKSTLEEYGWKIKNDSKVELTMDEVATKFGVDVKNLKIKK